MNTLKIQNLRCLKDTGEIDIKPLTVIVGENSSGKSSFIRFFPLMKQTLDTKRSEPILWYSNRYVDFGSFKESLCKNSTTDTISFQISFLIPLTFFYRRFGYFNYVKIKKYGQSQNKEIKININLKEETLYKMEIYIDENTIIIEFNSNLSVKTFVINEIKIKDTDKIKGLQNNYLSDILPTLVGEFKKSTVNDFDDEIIIYRNKYDNLTLYFIEQIKEYLKENQIKNIFIDKLDDIILHNINFIDFKIEYSEEEDNKKHELKELIDFINNDKIINNYILGMTLNHIISVYNDYMSDVFSNVRYIAPVRANAERYYRVQGLAVNEIDPRGENIAMLLYNLGKQEKNKFSKWVQKNFGFNIFTKLEGGHVSIYIRHTDNDVPINIVDTGFGYSQILPIIVQLWILSDKTTTRPNYLQSNEYILVIEQPELHLHPAMQGKLVDLFAKTLHAAKKSNINLKLIIETHSDHIVNRIGYLINKKLYNFNDKLTNILIFTKKNEYESNVKKVSYDEDGYLQNWPVGFFSTRG